MNLLRYAKPVTSTTATDVLYMYFDFRSKGTSDYEKT